jgi:hypothetical protein
MRRHLRVLLAASTMTLAFVPSILAAQSVPAPAGVSLPSAKNQVLSVQPITAMFTLYSAELERKLTPTLTLGVGGTYWSDGSDDADGSVDARYASGDVKLRYYPGATPFQGFSFGAQAGLTRVSGSVTNEDTGETEDGSTTGPTFGVALDYNWLLGASKSFYVGLGVGAKALFIDEDAIDNATVRYPTARVSIGYAF